jgi:D-lactate dehydrogenase
VARRLGSAVVHPSCSANHLQLAPKLHALAAALADKAVTPAMANCCGFAGDRGFLHPELTRSALADGPPRWRRGYDAYFGSNRTCEIGSTCQPDTTTSRSSVLEGSRDRPLGDRPAGERSRRRFAR